MKYKKNKLLLIDRIFLLFLITFPFIVFTQNVKIGDNSNLPEASAMLDVESNDKGFLMPRMTTTQRDAISNPAYGLMIYNIETWCLDVYFQLGSSGVWKSVKCGCDPYPDATIQIPYASTGNPVSFSAKKYEGATYSWVFDQGNPPVSSSDSIVVTWNNPGTYNVDLTIADSNGCVSSSSDQVIVAPCPFVLNFSNCGQIGKNGPSQLGCDTTYANTLLDNAVTVNAGFQEWTIPYSGIYRVRVAGAQGGDAYRNSGSPPPINEGGEGVIIEGDIFFNQGVVLKILVGQRIDSLPSFHSTASNRRGAGGGGGSFVIDAASNTPIIVAGGGGGAGYGAIGNNTNFTNKRATTSTSGRTGAGNAPGTGGLNGMGGGGSDSDPGLTPSSGGAGWLSDGGNAPTTTFISQHSTGGKSLGNGLIGGDRGERENSSPFLYGTEGGFGGGGGAWGSGGGGGGYSGGGAAGTTSGGGNNNIGSGGGGGSYIAQGFNITNISTSDGLYDNFSTFEGQAINNSGIFNLGQGSITITLICN